MSGLRFQINDSVFGKGGQRRKFYLREFSNCKNSFLSSHLLQNLKLPQILFTRSHLNFFFLMQNAYCCLSFKGYVLSKKKVTIFVEENHKKLIFQISISYTFNLFKNLFQSLDDIHKIKRNQSLQISLYCFNICKRFFLHSMYEIDV